MTKKLCSQWFHITEIGHGENIDRHLETRLSYKTDKLHWQSEL